MKIFAPNLYLCAYHLRKDNTQGETHPLWENCDRLLEHFTPKQLSPQLHLGEHRILLPPPQTEIDFNLSDESNLEGFIQPLQLQDSYGVFFNIGYDEENDQTEDVNLETLQQFNPQNRLQFPFSPRFPRRNPHPNGLVNPPNPTTRPLLSQTTRQRLLSTPLQLFRPPLIPSRGVIWEFYF